MKSYPKRTALEAIRVFCIECQGGLFQAVNDCADAACQFHPYRSGSALCKGQHRPTSAIKQYCLENCQAAAGLEEVRTCAGDSALTGPCPVYPFRMGKNPNIHPETRKKLQRIARERDPLGIKTRHNPQAHRPLDAPESTKSASGEL